MNEAERPTAERVEIISATAQIVCTYIETMWERSMKIETSRLKDLINTIRSNLDSQSPSEFL